jgi:hypothetical protein
MPLGKGYWYNRRTGRFLAIEDHAADACKKPERFGLTNGDLVRAVSMEDRAYTTRQDHVVITNEEDRSLVIIRVCQGCQVALGGQQSFDVLAPLGVVV